MATLESVLELAQQLDKRDQVLLAEKLYEGIVETEEIREMWNREALRRYDAYLRGEETAIDAAESIAKARKMIGQ